MERLSSSTEPQERSYTRATLGAVAAMGLAIGGIFMHNSLKIDDIEVAAQRVAHERNICSIESAHSVRVIGGTRVRVVVKVVSNVRPGVYSEQFDGPAMEVSLKDESSAYAGGIVVRNETSGAVLSETSSQLSEGPNGPLNTAHVQRIITAGNARYGVYRENIVDADVSGALVRDTHIEAAGLVACGSFVFNPTTGGQPRIVR